MAIVLQCLIVAAISIFCGRCVITKAQSPDLVKPDRNVGAAEVYYLKEKNKTRAQVSIHLFRNPTHTDTQPDDLRMDVIFESDGPKVVRPKYVYLLFRSDSSTGPKYQEEHDLGIFTESLRVTFRSSTFRTRLLSSEKSSSGGKVEVLVASVDYKWFQGMIEAFAVKLSLGKTYFVLKKEDIKALNDLNQTVEK